MDGNASGWTALILAAVSSIATLVLAIIKIVVDYKREGRSHQWLVDQEIRTRSQRLEVASAITAKIDENTEVNVKALDAANNITEKIYQSGLQLRADKEIV